MTTAKPSFIRLQRNGGKFPAISGDQAALFNARTFPISVMLSWLIQPPSYKSLALKNYKNFRRYQDKYL